MINNSPPPGTFAGILQNPSTFSKNVPQLLDFDGIGTDVANAKHPWLGVSIQQSWI